MDKFIRFLTKQQVYMSWFLWKTNFIPWGRRFWKDRCETHKLELIADMKEYDAKRGQHE